MVGLFFGGGKGAEKVIDFGGAFFFGGGGVGGSEVGQLKRCLDVRGGGCLFFQRGGGEKPMAFRFWGLSPRVAKAPPPS